MKITIRHLFFSLLRVLITFAAVLCLRSVISGQDATPPPILRAPFDATINVAGPACLDASVAGSVTYPFTASGGTGTDDYVWDIQPNPTYANGEKRFTIVSTAPDNSTVNITYKPNDVITCATSPNYTIRVTKGGVLNSGTMTIQNNATGIPQGSPKPIEIIMVVDVSGSMGDPAVCQCTATSPTGCNGSTGDPSRTKLDYLREVLLTIFNTLDNPMRTQDRFGFVTFESTAQVAMNFKDFTAAQTDVDNLLQDASPGKIVPLGWTAMGQGLKTAMGMWGNVKTDNSKKRVILLLTNGIQNIDPLVEKLGTTVFIDEAPRIRDGSGNIIPGASAGPEDMILSDFDVEIIPYAIFTPDNRYYELLQALAVHGIGGVSSSPYICDVNEPVTFDWLTAIRTTGTPKLVDFSRGKMSGTSGQETFTVKEVMNDLIVNVGGVGNHNFTSLKLEKITGGVATDITGFGTVSPPFSQASHHRVFNVSFPIAVPGGFTAEGDYRLSFTSDLPNVAYESTVIVDDKGLKQGYFATEIVPAGETLNLGTFLFQDATPVTNANVKAIIYKPKKPLGNAFAAKRVPAKFIKMKGPWGRLFPKDGFRAKQAQLAAVKHRSGNWEGAYIKQISISHPTLNSFKQEGDRMAIGEKKHLVLLNETNYRDIFDLEPIATIPLQHLEKGVYRGTYNGMKKTGLYHVRFQAEGNTAVVGDFKRFDDKTTLVRFGAPDRKKSCLFMLYESPYIISMRPVDTEGNLLGPNQVKAISVRLSDGSADAPVDYLDGRYLVPISIATDPDPNIVISIHDRQLYNGPLSGLQQKRGFFSLHGGLTFPSGDFDNFFDRSYFVEGKLGMRVYRQFGLQLKGGYYTFKDSANFSIYGIGGGVTFRQWLGYNFLTGVYLQAEANGGYYKPEKSDGVFGLNGGIGLVKPLGHCLNAILQSDYHRLDTKPQKTEFWTLGLGLQVRF